MGGSGQGQREAGAAAKGVGSLAIRSGGALGPTGLAEWLGDWDGSIIRAKGVVRVAGTDEVIGVSQAGPSVQAGPIGEWGPDEDRRTRLVFIGEDLDEAGIREELAGLAADEDGRTADPDAVFPV
ncbi:hypothetical protein B9G38_12915 [Halorubrum sp. SD612]|nr:hypothetical protein B9G38_12915 [Halorubrum sp. SD612]